MSEVIFFRNRNLRGRLQGNELVELFHDLVKRDPFRLTYVVSAALDLFIIGLEARAQGLLELVLQRDPASRQVLEASTNVMLVYLDLFVTKLLTEEEVSAFLKLCHDAGVYVTRTNAGAGEVYQFHLIREESE